MSTDAYARALARLYALAPRGIRLDLERVRRASSALGDPAACYPSLHVAGTNGKGSVAAMLDAILRAAGHRVGLYTSPHLHRFTERIRIDGREIGHAAVTRGLARIDDVLSRPGAPALTFFEVVTLLGLVTFAERRVDAAVVEVGLGGRLDATQLVEPVVSVITRIGLDHCDRLGDTLRQITREKAGIVRTGVPVVTAVSQPEVRRAVAERCRRLGAPLLRKGTDFDARRTPDGTVVYEDGAGTIARLRVGLAGHYQLENVALAVAAARASGIPVAEEAIRRGLAGVRWPGRFERVTGAPAVILDVAHNPDGAAALAQALAQEPGGPRPVLVFGVLADKDADAMLAALMPVVRSVIFTRPALDRARAPGELAERHGGRVVLDVGQAVAEARRRAGRAGLVVVTGSIFTVAQARQALLGGRLRANPPIGL